MRTMGLHERGAVRYAAQTADFRANLDAFASEWAKEQTWFEAQLSAPAVYDAYGATPGCTVPSKGRPSPSCFACRDVRGDRIRPDE